MCIDWGGRETAFRRCQDQGQNSRATRKWEVGPLYRRTHQAGLLAVQGRLGPGGGGKNTTAMGGHPLISMASQVLASATSGSESGLVGGCDWLMTHSITRWLHLDC